MTEGMREVPIGTLAREDPGALLELNEAFALSLTALEVVCLIRRALVLAEAEISEQTSRDSDSTKEYSRNFFAAAQP